MKRGVIPSICALAAAALFAPSTATALEHTYSFPSSAQGWTISQSETAPVQPATHYPDLGLIAAYDQGLETGCATQTDPCELLFMLSPGYPGGLEANYGGSLSFDLSVAYGTPTSAGVVYLDSADDAAPELRRAFSFNPDGRHVSVPLTEAGWKLCGGTPYSCADATEAQFRQVLTYAIYTNFMVDAAAGTGELYALDNVSLAEAEPSTGAPGPAPATAPGKKKNKCKRKAKKGGEATAAAAKRCKKRKKGRRSAAAATLAAAPVPSPGG